MNQASVMLCPTSHLDWNWILTFAEYTQTTAATDTDDANFYGATNTVISRAADLLADPTSGFTFSLAEVGYLRALAAADPGAVAKLAAADPARFVLLGGGITSPDNLLCHGEVFIRNYLLGRRWLRAAGLARFVQPVAWLPDDFGHDPQLPIVLAAMGIERLGLSRVPGSPQPFSNKPLHSKTSVADELRATGLVFPWVAADGSTVTTHYMPETYGFPFYGSGWGWDTFLSGLEAAIPGWPTTADGDSYRFAPAGGDFAFPSWAGGTWARFMQDYNGSPVDHIDAVWGTFVEFMDTAEKATNVGPVRTLQAQNYWTGFFASRPALKTLHHRAARTLLAAEAASSLLRAATIMSPAALDALDDHVRQAWEALVPSSHHDYVTGTSPDRVYWIEQLPMLELAVRSADAALDHAVDELAAAARPAPDTTGMPMLVFNPLGLLRGDSVVELAASDAPAGIVGVRQPDGGSRSVQRLPDGGLLVGVMDQAPLSCQVYMLQPGNEPAPPPLPIPGDTVEIDNGAVTVVIDRKAGWAITSFVDDASGTPYIAPGDAANLIRLYADSGNLYQFGNEPITGPGDDKGTFVDTGATFVGEAGSWLEAGPLRWRFRAPITDGQGNRMTVEYALNLWEPFVRIAVNGAAPPATTVCARFELANVNGSCRLVHGTPNHWDDHQPVPYWTGPTFRATHDWVQPITVNGRPGPMILHGGVPAWSIAPEGPVLGALLRNAPGTDRGAAGTDPAPHTLEYALCLPQDAPSSGGPIRLARQYTSPPIARMLRDVGSEVTVTRAPLAVVTAPSFIRSVRVQEGSTIVTQSSDLQAYAQTTKLVFGIATPDAEAGEPRPVTLTLPYLGDGTFEAELVTALEDPIDGGKLIPTRNTVTFDTTHAVTTVLVTVARPQTTPTNGKPSNT